MSLNEDVKDRLKDLFDSYQIYNEPITIFSAHPSIDVYSEKISNFLGLNLAKRQITEFKCGESYICLDESVRNKNVFLIVPSIPDVNSRLIETFFYMDAFKAAEADEINIILPCLPYARQDRRNEKREHIGTRVLAKIFDSLQGSSKTRLITFDMHCAQTESAYRNVDIEPLRLNALFANIIKKFISYNKMTLVSPDFGGVKRLESLKKSLSLGNGDCDISVAFIHKRRTGHNQCEACELVGEVSDRTAIIVDDIFDTGGSMINAARSVKAAGAKEVHVLVTHSYFSGDAIEKLAKAQNDKIIDKFIFTDTIRMSEEKYALVKKHDLKLYMIPTTILLADVIARIQKGLSLSPIYDDSTYIGKLYEGINPKEV